MDTRGDNAGPTIRSGKIFLKNLWTNCHFYRYL